jgi:hypothetical protein
MMNGSIGVDLGVRIAGNPDRPHDRLAADAGRFGKSMIKS